MVQVHPFSNCKVICLLFLVLLPAKSLSEEVCVPNQASSSCPPTNSEEETSYSKSQTKDGLTMNELPESDSLFHRSMQELEGILDKMMSSKDQMMSDLTDKLSASRKKMIEAMDSMLDTMSESKTKVMEGMDSMLGKMSESRVQVMEGMDSMLQKVTKAKQSMMDGLDNVLDNVAHSRLMEEIDQLIETVSHSKVMQELRALPQEIRQSFILSARNRSYIAAGVMVAIAAAILFSGAIYYAWCHHDAWSYYIGTIEEAKALLRQAKESSFIGRSRSSSEVSVTKESDHNLTLSRSKSASDLHNGKAHMDGSELTPLTKDSSSNIAEERTKLEGVSDKSTDCHQRQVNGKESKVAHSNGGSSPQDIGYDSKEEDEDLDDVFSEPKKDV